MHRYLLFFWLVVYASARVAQAQGVASQQANAHVILVLPPGENERALHRALSHVGVQVDFRRVAHLQRTDVLEPPEADDGVPRVFIDLGNPFVARICIADGRLEHFLLRELDMPTGLDELGREALAQAVESSMAALLDGETPGLSRDQANQVLGLMADARIVATPPAHRPEPPEPPLNPPRSQAERIIATPPAHRPSALDPPEFQVGLSLAYGAQLFAQQMPIVHGPSAGLTTRWWRIPDLGFFGNLGLLVPSEATDIPIGVRLWAIALRAGARCGKALSARTALEASAAAGPDVAFVTPRPGLDSAATLDGATRHYIYVLQLAVSLAVSLSPDWKLTITPNVEGDIRARHYDVESNGQQRPVLRPYRARPGLAVGLRWR